MYHKELEEKIEKQFEENQTQRNEIERLVQLAWGGTQGNGQTSTSKPIPTHIITPECTAWRCRTNQLHKHSLKAKLRM